MLFMSLRLRSGREEDKKEAIGIPTWSGRGTRGLGRAETNGRPGPDAGTVRDRP